MSANRLVLFEDSTTILLASATFNGTARQVGREGFGKFGFFRAIATSDQAGTLNIQQSIDGTTWMTTQTVAVTAASVKTLEDKLICEFVRVQYVNGGTNQGSFTVASALVAA